ncbi:hypothetical protein KAR91_33045 [Candidatus Pacearchaeota archaeon]|nr:hypothetical protein [Candidatus Pacearchaeota archaeon]
MANENKKNRREDPPCDTHELRLDNLEKGETELKLTMYGPDGRGGVNQAINDSNTNTLGTKKTVEGLKSMVYLFNIPVLVAIVGMAIKYIFFSKGA